ncbi:MAG: toll/interleukin-1 receptor domain-containing protein [Calditrichaceae bacterium]
MAKLFFSYSHKDEELRNELEIHLALLKRQGIITSWHDRRVTAGRDLDKTINAEIEAAQVILLLVSAHFLASDYCYEKEMKIALEKHNKKEAVVIPVILHPCDWHSSPFGFLRATPLDGKPVSMFGNLQEAFAIIAKDVRDAVNKLGSASKVNSDQKGTTLQNDTPDLERSSNLRIKRKFDDHEKDEFLEDSYEYMARYFEGSLQELTERNPQIKTRFKRLSETSFSAFIYDNGERVAECSVYYAQSTNSSSEIAYSYSGNVQRNSYNESISVVDNGYTLQLKPLGLQMQDARHQDVYSKQGAAEYYWSLFIRKLQE